MKSIGLIDYYISEWHANNYPGWIKQKNAELGLDYEVKFVWAEKDVSPVDGRNTDEWCEEYGAVHCNSIEELCEKSDYIMILAPSNPEKHLEYVKKAFPFGKSMFIDKTFAENLSSAEEIFRLGEESGTAFFSSSALRYATELNDIENPLALIVGGCISDLDEYAVHQIEMTVKMMKEKAIRVRLEKQAEQFICSVEFEHEKQALLIYSPSMPYLATASLPEGKNIFHRIEFDFFINMTEDILRFYESGNSSFNPMETLEVMRIREAILKGKEALGQWIPVPALCVKG